MIEWKTGKLYKLSIILEKSKERNFWHGSPIEEVNPTLMGIATNNWKAIELNEDKKYFYFIFLKRFLRVISGTYDANRANNFIIEMKIGDIISFALEDSFYKECFYLEEVT